MSCHFPGAFPLQLRTQSIRGLDSVLAESSLRGDMLVSNDYHGIGAGHSNQAFVDLVAWMEHCFCGPNDTRWNPSIISAPNGPSHAHKVCTLRVVQAGISGCHFESPMITIRGATYRRRGCAQHLCRSDWHCAQVLLDSLRQQLMQFAFWCAHRRPARILQKPRVFSYGVRSYNIFASAITSEIYANWTDMARALQCFLGIAQACYSWTSKLFP